MFFTLLVLACVLSADGYLMPRRHGSRMALGADKAQLVRLFRTMDDQYQNFIKSSALVASLEALNPTNNPGLAASFEKHAKGVWRVTYAPHIRAVEKLFFTSFDVYYFLEAGKLFSFVRFSTDLFGRRLLSGHLNASGTYGSLSESETTITWDYVWCDFRPKEEGPSDLSLPSTHFLPQIIQPLGKLAFIEAVSRFPVTYLDDNLVVFEFSLLGTKIVASKVSSKSISELNIRDI